MEAQGYNPYEQQLLSVYESCLENGKSGLNEKGLKLLCDKLQLEERSVDLISSLLEQSSGDQAITFDEFRNGLLRLLNNTQEIINNTQVINDSSSIMASSKYNDERHLSVECERLKESYIDISNDDNSVIIKNNSKRNILGESVITKSIDQQLYDQLDINWSGQVSFNGYSSLFPNKKKFVENSLDVETWNGTCVDDSNCSKNQHVIMFGPDHTYFIQHCAVVNLWQMAGVTDPTTLLHDLGFTNVNINLIELLASLTDELKSLDHELRNKTVTVTQVNLLRGALVLYQEEVRSMHTVNDQLKREKDKLKADVAEANKNANIIAQENDEIHTKLEKTRQEQLKQLELKHTESIKELTMQTNCERETYLSTIKSLKEQLQNVQQEEQLIRSKLADALNENHTLEIDNQNLGEQITKLKLSNNQLMRQMQMLAAEHDEVERNVEKENEQVISLVDRIKKLQSELALLRDQNDELTSEIEFLRSRTNNKIKNFDIHTNYIDNETNCVTDYEPIGKQGSEFEIAINDDKVKNLSHTIALIIRDLKNITIDRKTSTCSSDCVLKRNLSDIINTLESQILTKIAGKVDDLMKNEEEECEERASESLRDFVLGRNEKSRFNNSLSSNNDETNDNLDMSVKSKTSSLRDYPPRRGEIGQSDQLKCNDDKNISTNMKNSIDSVDGIDTQTIQEDRNKLNELLQEQEIKHNNEKKQLQEHCAKLESDLESLRTEYYQCEDYWANKLEEERQLIEQEQKISDEKLGELISKIAEYEEQFSMSDKNRNDGRLSPIEEKFNLEQQYIDLEEEYEHLKKQMEETINEKELQLIALQQKLNDSDVEMVDSCVQVTEIDDNKIMKQTLCQSNNLPLNYVLPHELTNIISDNGQAIATNINHYGLNQKQFGSGKLNKIVEHSISDDNMLVMPSKMTVRNGNIGCSCSCQQLDTYSNVDEIPKIPKIAMQRISHKRVHNNVNADYNSLIEQKECLIKEIMELQNFHSNRLYSGIDGHVTKIDMNFIKNLLSKLQIQDHKRKTLQINLKHQKQHTEKMLEHTWKQHCNEVENLQYLLKDTQNSLYQQMTMNSIFMEKLSKSDLLLKDLYVENAHLKANVERLGERCHMLTNLGSGSTSV